MTLEFIVSNLAGYLRWEELEGRRHLVGPMVIGGEGVLNGSQGAFFYPASEWESSIDQWNGKPIIVNHAELAGKESSAADPKVFNRQKVGVVFNAKWDGKARTEAWIDEEKANQIDPRIIRGMLANQMIEVSTGLKVNPELTSGEFQGTPYTAEAVNYRPDHVAILLDDVGAYSIMDGGGLLQLNKESGTTAEDIGLNLKRIVNNALSHEDLRKRVTRELRERYPMEGDEGAVFIEAVYDSKIIYEVERNGLSKLYATEYVVTDDQITLGVASVEVAEKTVYETASGVILANLEKEDEVSKEIEAFDKGEIISALIANERTQWTEDDRPALEALEEDVIQKLEPTAVENQDLTREPPDEAKLDEAKLDEAKLDEAKPPTLESLIANASPADQDLFLEMRASHAADRSRLTEVIVANEANDYTLQELEAMPVSSLKKLAKLAAREPSSEELVANFAGMPGGSTVAAPAEQEPLGLPEWPAD
jgi:hypothetical protein